MEIPLLQAARSLTLRLLALITLVLSVTAQIFSICTHSVYTDVRPEIVDNKNGTYTVNYKPLDKGDHTVTILHENQHVANSPYHIVVNANKDGN